MSEIEAGGEVEPRLGELPAQQEMPFAIVQGAPLMALPQDLYIPPDALEVFLDSFEGPLDLLLYLIRRQNLDILEIPIADITDQYIEYVELMKEVRLELAAEYLVMAAMLAEIKSRMLLPRPAEAEEEDDPRAELVRRLQEYERFKRAAVELDELPRLERDIYAVQAEDSPPTFIFFARGGDLSADYVRYMENRLREAYDFVGTPLHIVTRRRHQRFAG